MSSPWPQESMENADVCMDVAVAANADGRLEIYTSNIQAGQIYHKWQEFNQDKSQVIGWSAWAGLPFSEDHSYLGTFFAGNTNLLVGLTANKGERIQVVTQGAWGVAQLLDNGDWPGHASRLASPPDTVVVTCIGRSHVTSDEGSLYVFGVAGGSSKVYYSTQGNAGGGWSDWRDLGVPAQGAYGVWLDDWSFRSFMARKQAPNGAVGANQDGRVEIFYPGEFGVFHNWQDSLTEASQWAGWAELPLFNGYYNYSNCAVIQNGPARTGESSEDSYRLELFALSANDASKTTFSLWHCWQATQNGGWGGWGQVPGATIQLLPLNNPQDGVSTPGPGGDLATRGSVKGPLRTARQADGSITIFANTTTGISYVKQNGANNPFNSEWVELGGPGNITGFDVGQNLDGTLSVFAASGGAVFHYKQSAQNSDVWGPEAAFPVLNF